MTSKRTMRERIEKLEEKGKIMEAKLSALESILGIETLQRLGAKVHLESLRQVIKANDQQYTKLLLDGEL